MPERLPGALQVMSPNGPSALAAPGPQEVGGEHVEGHQDLIPAMQSSGTVNGISPPGREVLVLQASEGNQALAPSGLAQAPFQGAGLDLVPTRLGDLLVLSGILDFFGLFWIVQKSTPKISANHILKYL